MITKEQATAALASRFAARIGAGAAVHSAVQMSGGTFFDCGAEARCLKSTASLRAAAE